MVWFRGSHRRYRHPFFLANLKGLILSQNILGCLWQPLNRTIELHHNINFPKWVGLNIQILHWKSMMFDVELPSPNMSPWSTDYKIVNPKKTIKFIIVILHIASWAHIFIIWPILSDLSRSSFYQHGLPAGIHMSQFYTYLRLKKFATVQIILVGWELIYWVYWLEEPTRWCSGPPGISYG